MRHRRTEKSKKHKKLKSVDPFYSGNRRWLLDKTADRANVRPKDVDTQEIPRRLQELMKVKQMAKEGLLVKKKKKKHDHEFGVNNDPVGPDLPGMNRPLKPVPKFQKKKGEKTYTFISRIHQITNDLINKTKEEDKLGVDIIEHRGGKIEIKKRKLEDLEPERKLGKEDSEEPSKKKLKRINKKKLKLEKMKEKRRDKHNDDFSHLKDEVKFGEVVQQPPNLNVIPTKANRVPSVSKPGKRPLLLKKLLPSEVKQSVIFPVQHTNDLTVRRKFLSISDRRQLDSEKQRAINAYKLLKQQRMIQSKRKPVK